MTASGEDIREAPPVKAAPVEDVLEAGAGPRGVVLDSPNPPAISSPTLAVLGELAAGGGVKTMIWALVWVTTSPFEVETIVVLLVDVKG